MKKTFLLLLFFVFAVYSEPFAADYVWGKTKWGMTIAQVNKAVGKKFKFHQKNKNGDDVYVLNGHKVGKYFYDVHAVFGSGGLSQILILKKGAQQEIKDACSEIAANLNSRADGKGILAGQGASSRNWQTKDANISLLCLQDDLFLNYSKIKNDGTSDF
ncbi:hypothetical protein [Desulfovibrio falkowii]|uniref:Uncharacterized protein n=1 Tax=Desulfovibrio falkowii TaxID=3136602 RepID=A0ABQ0EAA4_9BACT